MINYPAFSWGIRPDLKNHIGAPESFYSGQLGVFIGGIKVFRSDFHGINYLIEHCPKYGSIKIASLVKDAKS